MMNEYERADKRLEKDHKDKKTARIKTVAKHLNIKTLRDSMIDPVIGLEKLLMAFEALEPAWVSVHNEKVEATKPEKMRSELPSNTKIEDIVKMVGNDEIEQLSLCLTVSNRIAHEFSKVMDEQIYSCIAKDIDKSTEKQFKKQIKKYFKYKNGDTPEINVNLERKFKSWCHRMGTSIDKLEEAALPELIQAEGIGFSLKNDSLLRLATILKDYDDINYGVIDTINPNGKSQKAFVMDLPLYGQFSVHLLEPKLDAQGTEPISERMKKFTEIEKEEYFENEKRKEIMEALKGKEYYGKFYNKKNFILNKNQSEQTRKFINNLKDLTEKEEEKKWLNLQKNEGYEFTHQTKVKDNYQFTRGEKNER